jgi:dihydroxy-acid dehydratase
MEDFFYAGGLPALMKEISAHLHLDCLTVNGKAIGENIQSAAVIKPEVIRPESNPLSPTGGTVILRGSLAPEGAVLKTSAASPALLRHTGPAVVFENLADMEARVNDPALPVTAASVLVLKSAGPQGGPGMPEWGMLPIPEKLLKQGVRDMLRISDARMSGTAYGTCVLHVSPESHIGGPLALVKDGDPISLDADARTLNLNISASELASRRAAWIPPAPHYTRGYGSLYLNHVTQAHQGCDFAFLNSDSH